jgi:HSP90 family molecular chaperone
MHVCFFYCLKNELFLCYDVRYVWESKADGSFAISEDTENEPLGRGTEIRLHLRDEAKEYLEESKLKVNSSYCFMFSVQSSLS